MECVAFFQDTYAGGLNSRNIAALLPCVDSGHTDAEQRRMLHAERDRIHDQCRRLRATLRRLDAIIAATAAHP